MNKNMDKNKTLTEEQLDALIEEATVDCYDNYECLIGFSVMIQDNIHAPFPAKVVGEEVTVTDVTEDDNTILAVCQRNGKEYKVNILDLEADYFKIKGSEWIAAYRAWHGGITIENRLQDRPI